MTSLNTRATIIAVTNPKGQYDPDQCEDDTCTLYPPPPTLRQRCVLCEGEVKENQREGKKKKKKKKEIRREEHEKVLKREIRDTHRKMFKERNGTYPNSFS